MTVTVGAASVTGSLNVVSTYPNLFSVNSSGLAAAYVQYQNGEIANVYRVQDGAIVAQPVSVGTSGNAAYLVLAGSGLGSASSVAATIGGVSAAVSYAGTQGTYGARSIQCLDSAVARR